MNKSIIKDTVALFIITLVAGIFLGFVYEITQGPIANEQQKAKEEAYKEVFEGADSFKEYDLDVEATDEMLLDAGYASSINEIMEVHDASDEIIGYVLTVTSHEGYGGDIQFVMGVDLSGTLNGISFLSISETAGLGMKAKDESFYSQFAGKNVDQFVYTKTGKQNDNEIDALSGATITTNAVANTVNAGLYYIDSIGGGSYE